jgi:hypothetical protein
MSEQRRAGASDAPTSNEIMSGVTRSARHDALLASYLLGLGHGPSVVRNLIVADLDGFLDLGLKRRAADQLVVLRAFLAQYPETARGVRSVEA